jgi:hypothetical protein
MVGSKGRESRGIQERREHLSNVDEFLAVETARGFTRAPSMLIQRDDSPEQSPSKLSKQRRIAIPLTDGTTFSSRREPSEISRWTIPKASDF